MREKLYVVRIAFMIVPFAFVAVPKPSIAGSINTACIVPAPTSGLVVNVKNTGAAGNGSTDDTATIQAAINTVAGTGGVVLVPSGTYMINALASLNLKSNMTLLMQGATLQAIPNASARYNIINIDNISNVKVIGGTLKGERANHQGATGEWGTGIRIATSANVVIEGVASQDNWGDGFYVGSSDGQSQGSSNVLLCGVISNNNRRQGLSIVAANGMVVKNSIFSNTNGTAPEGGIDIEPNVGNTVNNVQILNSVMSNNNGAGIQVGVPSAIAAVGNTMISGVVIKGNISTNNGVINGALPGIIIANTSGHQIINNNVFNNLQDGIELMYGASNNIVRNNITVNNGTVANPANGIGILMYDRSGQNTISNNITTGNTKANLLDLVGTNVMSGNVVK